MITMWNDRQFWLDATWRAFRSFCQSLAALLGGSAMNLLNAPWVSMLSVSATAALASLLMSIDRSRAVTAVEAGFTPTRHVTAPPPDFVTATPMSVNDPAAANYQP